MNTLTTAEVLRHAADNLDAGREWCHGLQYRDTVVGWSIAYGLHATTPFRDGAQFRLAPKTITYTVKDQPGPLRVAPKDGTQVWTVCTSGASDFKWWSSSDWQIDALERGNLFATKEDAQAADAARLAAYRGAV